MFFSDFEHKILKEICDTFVGPTAHLDGDTEYWDFRSSSLDLTSKIEETASKLPQQEIADLKKVLKLISSGYVGLIYGGPLKSFDKLTDEQKEKCNNIFIINLTSQSFSQFISFHYCWNVSIVNLKARKHFLLHVHSFHFYGTNF